MSTTRAPLRLPTGAVTVLLGADADRRRLLVDLDEDTARCADGHGVPAVRRLSVDPVLSAEERARLLHQQQGLAVLFADRLTTGLDGHGRRTVLQALRAVARTGTAVLVDDVDPVAALGVADAALRVGPDGAVRAERLEL